MAGPLKISITHEALMDWIINNPEKKLKDCASAFGYSQAWLSSIINSGCFQARLAEKRSEITALVALDVPQKLSNVANMALDRISDHLENSTDPDFAFKAAELALRGLGVGAKQGGITLNMQNNGNVQQVFASPAELAQARMLMAAQGVPLPLPVPQQLEEPPALSGGGYSEVLQVQVNG